MAQQLQALIVAAHSLSPREKLELLQAISQDLQQAFSLAEDSAAFWAPRSIEEIVSSQTAPVITDIRDLAADFWPEEESADDINRFVAERRHADRLSGA